MNYLTAPITITIPIGPYESNTRYLQEALDSISDQFTLPDEVMLVIDGGPDDRQLNMLEAPYPIKIYKIPWRTGVASAFNIGVAVAKNDLVIMLGSDDKLMPKAVQNAWAVWRRIPDPLGYFHYGVKYSDGREQNTPCNAAMVHKELWRLTGGFPLEAAIGACDTMFISRMLAADGRLGKLYSLSDITGSLDYWYRVHDETDTRRRGKWMPIIDIIRGMLTEEVVE